MEATESLLIVRAIQQCRRIHVAEFMSEAIVELQVMASELEAYASQPNMAVYKSPTNRVVRKTTVCNPEAIMTVVSENLSDCFNGYND